MRYLLQFWFALLFPIRLSLTGDDAGGGGGGDTGGGDAPAFDIREFIDGQGNFVKEGWASRLGVPDALEQKFKTMGGAFGSYANLERLNRSSSKVEIPNEHSSEDDWSMFFDKIGRPSDPKTYELGLPEEAQALGLDDAALEEVRSIAHKAGLTQKQLAPLGEWFSKRMMGAIDGANAAAEARHEAAVSALRKEWGVDYDAKVASAEAGAAALGLTADELKSNPEISNNPAFIKAMAKAAEMVREKPATALRQMGERLNINTPEEARARIATIRSDKNHPYNNPSASPAARQAATDELSKLYRLANPEDEE